jgi:hypothetical protein
VPNHNGQDRQCSQSVEFLYAFHFTVVAGLDRASSGFPRAIFIIYHAGRPADPDALRTDGGVTKADCVMDKSYSRDIDAVKSTPNPELGELR